MHHMVSFSQQSGFIYSKFLCAFYITLPIRNSCIGNELELMSLDKLPLLIVKLSLNFSPSRFCNLRHLAYSSSPS